MGSSVLYPFLGKYCNLEAWFVFWEQCYNTLNVKPGSERKLSLRAFVNTSVWHCR